jgi:KipI family sensor histidine kinase inhibitor
MIRIREAGDSALLLELDAVVDPAVNADAVAIAAAVRLSMLPGIRDVVSTYRTVAVYFDPLIVDVSAVRAVMERASTVSGTIGSGRSIDVPVVYGGEDGPDLAAVAAHAGLTPEEVIARHAATPYRVFMLGFLPGFAYMGTAPPEIAVPRRPTPRKRVPGGSVALADRQTAVYPWDSPGGWQIIGRTPLRVFDPARDQAALFAPGDTVTFVPTTAEAANAPHGPAGKSDGSAASSGRHRVGAEATGRAVTVLRPGLFTTVQDAGRWGHQSTGVSVTGALDLAAHRAANALVGNDARAATIEATLIGPELRLESDATVAVSGGDLGATVDSGPLPLNTAARLRAGSVLQFRGRRSGARTSIAFDGGVAVAPVLGSRATHALTRIGGLDGRPLAMADRVPLGGAVGIRARRRMEFAGPVVAGGARVRVLPGPQDDFFADEALATLQASRFIVSPQSDRMGFRLQGARIPRVPGREMISDATFTGAIQVPASGEPILLMADRQTTGGYPQLAIVITADLPLAAQLAPGDWIEFLVCSRTEAIKALVEQEGKLLALG